MFYIYWSSSQTRSQCVLFTSSPSWFSRTFLMAYFEAKFMIKTWSFGYTF
jgi:hypothetical protein